MRRFIFIVVGGLGYSLTQWPMAVASTSTWRGPGSDFNASANWTSGVPIDAALFQTASPLSISLSAVTILNSLTFASSAASYSITITTSTSLTLSGAGATNQSSHAQTIVDKGELFLHNSASLSGITINNVVGGNGANLFDQSSAGNATIVNNGANTNFGDQSTAGNATIMNLNGGYTNFLISSSAGNATIVNNGGSTNFSGTATAGQAVISNNSIGGLGFFGSSTAGNAKINDNYGGTAGFAANSNAGDATITNFDGGGLNFNTNSSAGNATIHNMPGGGTNFFDTTTAGNSRITNESSGDLSFSNNATAGNAFIVNNAGAGTEFLLSSNAGNSTITNYDGSSTEFDNSASAGNATIVNNAGGSIVFYGTSTGGNATLVNNDGDVDLSGSTAALFTIGSIAGSGSFELGAETVEVGNNNLSSTVSGEISGDGASLIKIGNGTLTLSGQNTYTGSTTVMNGTLNLSGSVAGSIVVDSQGTLTGTGDGGSVTNNGLVSLGNNGIGRLRAEAYSGSGTLETMFNGASNSGLSVSGTAFLTGGKLDILGSNFVVGSYNIISAGTVHGTFLDVSVPASAFLTFVPIYTTTGVFLSINFASPFTSVAVTPNQKNVAEALDRPKAMSTISFTKVLTSIASLDARTAQQAYDDMSGDALSSFERLGFQSAAGFLENMENPNSRDVPPMNAHLNAMIAAGSNSYESSVASSTTAPCGFWSKGLGTFSNVTGSSAFGSPAFHTTTSGYQGGYDYPIGYQGVIGVSGAYTTTNLNVEDRNSFGGSTALQSGIYTRYFPDPWMFNVEAAYTSLSNTMYRTLAFSNINEATSSSFQSRIFSTAIKASYVIQRNEAFSIEPSVGFVQHRLEQDGFSESGAPGLDLQVNPQTLNTLTSEVGVEACGRYAGQSHHPVRFAIRSSWNHEFMTTGDPLTAQFSDASETQFTVMGTARDRNFAELGVNIHVLLNRSWDGFLDYGTRLSASESSQSLVGGISIKW